MNLKISGLIFLSFLVGIFLYPYFPSYMASHWGITGQVNGYLPKFWGVFLMPLMSVFLFWLFFLLPRIDPLKANVAKFRAHFHRFILVLMLFFFYLYWLTLIWNLGVRFNMMQLLSPAFAVLFYFTGILVENARPNWFIGIRTPWTLSSPRVWQKTHTLGGKLFKLCGAIALLGIIFPQLLVLWIFIPVVITTIITIIYSYHEYSH
jgi:uncharacterized membrane protein